MIFEPQLLSTRYLSLFDPSDICTKLSNMSVPSSSKFNGEQLRVVGFPAYLANVEADIYEVSAFKNNIELWNVFKPLYQDVLSVLSKFFNEKIYFSSFLSVPGFHVIRNNMELPVYYGGIPHTDIPHINTKYLNDAGVDAEQYSFTLLLSENRQNIGLSYWDRNISEADAKDVEPTNFINYRIGNIAIFCSDLVHQITKFDGVGERITMQGHLIRLKGKLIAYW